MYSSALYQLYKLRKTFKFYFYKKIRNIFLYSVILLIFTSSLHNGYRMCKCMIKSFYKTYVCYIFIFFKYIYKCLCCTFCLLLIVFFRSFLFCSFEFYNFQRLRVLQSFSNSPSLYVLW